MTTSKYGSPDGRTWLVKVPSSARRARATRSSGARPRQPLWPTVEAKGAVGSSRRASPGCCGPNSAISPGRGFCCPHRRPAPKPAAAARSFLRLNDSVVSSATKGIGRTCSNLLDRSPGCQPEPVVGTDEIERPPPKQYVYGCGVVCWREKDRWRTATMATKARLTAEDLLRMPDDDVRRELVNGEIV